MPICLYNNVLPPPQQTEGSKFALLVTGFGKTGAYKNAFWPLFFRFMKVFLMTGLCINFRKVIFFGWGRINSTEDSCLA